MGAGEDRGIGEGGGKGVTLRRRIGRRGGGGEGRGEEDRGGMRRRGGE